MYVFTKLELLGGFLTRLIMTTNASGGLCRSLLSFWGGEKGLGGGLGGGCFVFVFLV